MELNSAMARAVAALMCTTADCSGFRNLVRDAHRAERLAGKDTVGEIAEALLVFRTDEIRRLRAERNAEICSLAAQMLINLNAGCQISPESVAHHQLREVLGEE